MGYKPKDMSLDIHSNHKTNDYTCSSSMVATSWTGGCKGDAVSSSEISMAITGAIRTSPTAALEVITGLLPLNIHIKQVAMTTRYRINSLKNWKHVQNLGSHSHILEKMHKEVPFTGMRGGHMKTCFLFDTEFKIMIPARESWNKYQKALLPENSRAVYTDGFGGPLGGGSWYIFRKPCRSKYTIR